MSIPKKLLLSLTFLSLCTLSAYATTTGTHSGKTSIGKKNKITTSTEDARAEELAESSIQPSQALEYKCELGNTLSLYKKSDDDEHLALRWKNHLYGLERVSTSTGAHRFENRKAGLIWISIPAKSLLLDSHKGQQLANECKLNEPPLATRERTVDTQIK